MRWIGILALLALCAGCASGGQRITDFSDRSVAYGWIDIGDVDANRLHSVVVYQLQPQSKTPYYNVKVVKFEGGYLFYSFAFAPGAFKLYELSGQRCMLVLCSNSTFSYSFGKQGGTGAVRIDRPGVYHFGSLKLDKVRTGLFKPGKFDVQEADDAPSHRQMLEAILEDAREVDATIASRVEARLKQL